MRQRVRRVGVGPERGRHECLLYRTRKQKLDAIQRTVKDALRRGERCLVIVHGTDHNDVIRRLREGGLDPDTLARGGALTIEAPADPREICHRGALAERIREQAGREEDSTVGTLVVMDSSMCAPAMEHEGGLDEVAASERVRIVCLYHLSSRVSPTRVSQMLRNHRHTRIWGAELGELPWKGEIAYLDEAYSLLLEVEDEAFFVADEESRVLLLNEAAGALLETDAAEVLAHHVAELLPEPAAAQLEQARHEALQSGEPVTFRLELNLRGRGRSWLVTVGGYRSGDGTPYTFGIIRDLAELKQAQQKLRFTAQLLDVIDQAVIATDRHGTIIFWNRGAEELYGWQAQEVLGLSVVEVVPGRLSREKGAEIMKSLGEGHSWSGDFTVQRRDGTEFLAHVTDTPIRDDAGRLVGIIGISFDITDRRRAEEALATSEERFRRYLDLGLIGISISAPDRRIIEVNDQVCEILGYPREELLEKSWPQLTHPDDLDRSDEVFHRIVAGEADSYAMEKRYIRKDGEVIECVVSVTSLRRKDGSLDSFVALLQDITDRKRAEREIAAYQQQLSLLTAEMYRLEEEERKHLASVLHDQIGQNLALSKMKLESLHLEKGDGVLKQEIRQISALLDDVIKKTRSLTTELRPPVLHELGLKAAVESLCEEFQAQTGLLILYNDNGIAFPIREPLSTLLFRGVRELLVNVVKHARATRVRVEITTADGVVTATVADDGVGFDPSKRRFKGSFGLFSLTERLRHVGGRVEVTSAPGKGTRIELVAPLDDTSSERGS